MQKTILITGATDGIGLETARLLVGMGHQVLLHGRSAAKLEIAVSSLAGVADSRLVETCVADLARFDEVEALARAVTEKHSRLDVLINNAGVFMAGDTVTSDGLDVRFVVNTVAPYLLTTRLLPLFGGSGRVINVSSAAQSPVDLDALVGKRRLTDGEAYAQSKLALTMWSRYMARVRDDEGPVVMAVNPGSLLGSKMVKQAFGMAGKDLRIGADILARAALAEEFASASGQYFDNDSGQFAAPHADALDPGKVTEVVSAIEAILKKHTNA
ncbi:MAG: SDR family NAD(P)-dependent oxidoreductase [Rhodanobacter sp.]|nr:MAG: SDR family NAD(P)-dependent oxidoreductase [Rhodanobacter sp.]